MDNKKVPADTGTKSELHTVLSIAQIETFEWAYMERFGLSLFPIKERDKVPMTPNGFKDATNDLDTYRGLHGGRPHNVGMPTGRINGLFVLDIDPRHGGDETLKHLFSQYGPMPHTWQAQTQSGGVHYFFRWDEHRPVANRANVLPGLDIRGDGGYVLVAPSVVTGKYKWINSPSKSPLAEAPNWLYQLLTNSPQSGNQKDLTYLADGVESGGRNVSITELSGMLLGRGVPVKLSWALIDAYNKMYCYPPLDETELVKTFQSITQREINKRLRQQRKWVTT